MKLKNYNLRIVILTILASIIFFSAKSQYITFPVNGMVFQQNSSGLSTVNFTFSEDDDYPFSTFYRVKDKDGNIVSGMDRIVLTGTDKTFDQNVNLKGYYKSETLSKGWYSLEYYREFVFNFFSFQKTFRIKMESVEFGVGDVYFIAGQSNASGYDDNAYDQVVSYSTDSSDPDQGDNKMTRSFGYAGDAGPNDAISKGLPYKRTSSDPEFLQLSKSVIPIYPNGVSSWSWAPLGNEFANQQDTPTLFFNNAYPGQSLVYDWVGLPNQKYNKNSSSTLIGKFYQTIRFYGNILGAKSVLWHQGERDSKILAGIENNASDVTNYYSSSLDDLISSSRLNTTTGLSTLPWFVSKVSYTARGNNNSNSCISTNTLNGYKDKYNNGNLLSYQNSSLTKVFQGVRSDFIDQNDPDGRNNTIFSNSTTDCWRAPMQRIHFSGNSLGKLGSSWYQAINDSYSQATPQTPTVLMKLSSVSKSGSNYTLTVTPPQGVAISQYYWCKNDAGVNNAIQVSGSPSSNSINLNSGERVICYALSTNGRYYASQPFIATNCANCRNGSSNFQISPSSLSFGMTGQTKTIEFTGSGDVWTLQSLPNWVSNIEWDEVNQRLNISVNANNTGTSRSGTINFYDYNNSSSILGSLSISQSASSNDIGLTTLNPTSASAGWGSPNYNGLNVGGNDIYISGIKYTQGIGTHAQSHITYNIPSGYQYFKGKVGRDDAADGCNCGDMLTSFTIKFNGATVWNSGQHGISTPAEDFNVNLGGSGGTLELINNAGANNWGDWADWVNIYLSNTSGSGSVPAPINYSANPNNLTSPGNTTLSATCNTGTVTWSTGQTGSQVSTYASVTTNYTVKCVSGSQESDPRTVNVTVGTSSCSVLSDNLVMGTWNVTGDQLVSRFFHSDYWLVQKVNVNGSSYDEFVVRAGEMLQRSDVSLNNGSYSGLVNCYALEYSAYGGLLGPNHSSTVPFATPSGYSLYYSQDGTPYYSTYNTSSGAITNGGCYRIKSVANNKYLQAIGGDFNEYHSGNTGNDKIWKFTTSDNTNWKIKSASGDGKYLYAEGTYCGARVKRTSNTSQANQLWQFDQNGNDFRFFLPNGTTWDHEGASTLNNLQVCGDNTQGYQTWRLVSLEGVSCPSGVRVGNTEAGRIEEVELPLLTIAPNPTDGLIHVSLNASQEGPAILNLLDITGKKYLEHSLIARKGLNQFDIDATWASPGTYLLQAITGDKTGSQRVVIE